MALRLMGRPAAPKEGRRGAGKACPGGGGATPGDDAIPGEGGPEAGGEGEGVSRACMPSVKCLVSSSAQAGASITTPVMAGAGGALAKGWGAEPRPGLTPS